MPQKAWQLFSFEVENTYKTVAMLRAFQSSPPRLLLNVIAAVTLIPI